MRYHAIQSAATRLLAVAASLFLIVPQARAWIPYHRRTEMRLTALAEDIAKYRSAIGDYPRSDATSTWEEKLAKTGLSGWLHIDQENGEIVDAWDHPLVYLPPSPDARPGDVPLIRSLGTNGADDHGEGDDLTFGQPHNIGYYGRKGWIPGAMLLIIFSLVSIALWAVQPMTAEAPRRRIIAAHTLVALLGIVLSAGTASTYHPCPSDQTLNYALWLTTFIGWPVLAVMCATWLITMTVDELKSARTRDRAERGLCLNCAYQRAGLNATTPCPECGVPPPPQTPHSSPAVTEPITH